MIALNELKQPVVDEKKRTGDEQRNTACIWVDRIQSRSKVLSPVDEHFKLSTLKQTFLNPPYSTGKYRDGLTINGIEGFQG